MSTPEETFREEASELLLALEEALLELEERPDDMDSVGRAFRAMHTIKGSGSMFGFDNLAAFTHHMENAFDLVREGEISISKELINISLDSGDHIRKLLDAADGSPELESAGKDLLARLSGLLPDEIQIQTVDDADENSQTDGDKEGGKTWHIRIKPSENTFVCGMDPMPILRELSGLGSCHITTLMDDVGDLSKLNPENCSLSWDLLLTTEEEKNTIDDIFIFVQEDWSIDIKVIDSDEQWSDEPQDKRIGEILIARGDVTEAEIQQALSRQKQAGPGKKLTGDLLSATDVSADKIKAALKEQKVLRDLNKQRNARQNTANVKVPAEKLDMQMDLVGELVIAQARLHRSAVQLNDPDLITVTEDMERLITELRDNTLRLRMLPIGTTFSRFRRLVRDLSNDLGKEIELITEGAETELDKTVIDRLGDPLVHLIRNSIDHGIETPDEREAKGKPRKGVVRLSAVHSESHVVIRIEDDGNGLDAGRIRSKALERGLISEDAQLEDDELYNMVFDAGFSTAEKVSNVSGRGVGMDVVKRSIESLRGKVHIESNPGKGSTVIVELPLTLAIIEGLLVKVEEETYVLPLTLVEECIELSADEVMQANGNHLIEVRGELVPYLRLREWFGENRKQPDIEQIVVARMGDTRFGFTVDQVIGQHQTVIKSLGKLYEGVKGLSGATILGDGTVALILDAPRLVQSVLEGSRSIH